VVPTTNRLRRPLRPQAILAAGGAGELRRRLKHGVRAMLVWPPLNRALTSSLRRVLPARLRSHRALARFAPRTGTVEATLPGGRRLRLGSRGDDEIANHLFWRGWAAHEPETAQPFYELARHAGVTLDIGAHVGYFALLAAHANPAGRVYAFEPLTPVRERLQSNIALNGVANVTSVAYAAGSPAGSAEFFHETDGMPSTSSLSSSFIRSVVPEDHITSCTVDVVEIDDFVRAAAIERVDLVKIDTETTEAAVFRGMLDTLRRDRPNVFCEVLDQQVADAVEALLTPLDYEFFLLTDSGPVRREHLRPHGQWRNFIFRPRTPCPPGARPHTRTAAPARS
jgi:FkbM family methyltransferase